MGDRWESAARTARALAHEAAILAANMQAGITAREKDGNLGPVTAADVAVETLILRRLEEAFPNDGILSEETRLSSIDGSGTLWCVDPIDGTREYVQQLPEYAVQIGVIHRGQPMAGAVALPAHGIVYWGWRGGGAWRNDVPLSIPPCPAIHEATLVHTRSRPNSTLLDAVRALGPAKTIVAGGVGYKVSRIFEQKAHLYLHTGGGTTWWDSVAPAAVLLAAGGVVKDASVKPLDFTHRQQHDGGLLFGAPQTDVRVRAAR